MSGNMKVDVIVSKDVTGSAAKKEKLIDALNVLPVNARRNNTMTSQTENLGFFEVHLQFYFYFPPSSHPEPFG